MLAHLRTLRFRHVAGAICFLAGLHFIRVDATILWEGAARYASTPEDKWRLGTIAATVPVIVSMMPFLFMLTWRPGKRFGRPSMWTIVISVVWLTFVSYNILGAGGAISFIRTDVLTARKFDVLREKDTTKRREVLQRQLDAIERGTRPAAQVEALVQREKASVWWGYTAQCREASNGQGRRYCAALAKLEAELGAAKAQERLTAQIAELDGNRVAGGWTAEIVDPSAAFWSSMTGLSEAQISRYAPIATPVVLQLGSWFFIAFGLILWGFTGHREALIIGRVSHPSADTAAGLLPAQRPAATPARAPASIKVVPLRGVSRQEQLARWFFAECCRPVTDGGISEAEWYRHYLDVCEQSNDSPMLLSDFRKIAADYIQDMQTIEGVIYYMRVLPNVPSAA